jgi:hypothetical protein
LEASNSLRAVIDEAGLQDPATPTCVLTSLKATAAFWPRTVTAALHATMVRADLTASSTAGPSWFCRNAPTHFPDVSL